MIDTFSGTTIYGNWDDWYLPNDEEDNNEESECPEAPPIDDHE